MPTDVVQVQRNRWLLRNARREFNPSNLFGGQWGRLTPADIVDGLDVEYDEKDGQFSGIRRYPVLPATTRQLVAQHGCQHPGVALDKLAYRYGDQNLAKGTLSDVVRVNQSLWEACRKDGQHWYHGQFARWQETICRCGPGAVQFRCVTSGPLTLHLARASALENAGICLHPLYGFTYLPGSGLKGMARAYAETVWFPAQYAANEGGLPKDEVERGKAVDAWRTIEAVFGWAPNSDNKKPWKPRDIPGHEKHDREHCGQIVFHDAWPTTWPKLIVDILNNHHAGYYQGDDAPGDWDNPVPVYFLAVERDTEFELALAKRRDDVPEALLHHARQWLLGALCHLGAGAKTNAGYGCFKPVEGQRPALVSPRHATFEATLELVTPAFLAGANQQADDCDLRPATLRGLVRWWWRTMHAGFIDVPTLQAMEAAIWGDTVGAGAIKVEISKSDLVGPNRFNFKDGFEPKPDFKRQHALADRPNNKTTQGLFYASYGMDEGGQRQPKQRFYLDSGSRWTIRFVASSARFFRTREDANGLNKQHRGIALAAGPIMEQAVAALWLLCQFGGVGAKSRKGFGSMSVSEVGDNPGDLLARLGNIDACRDAADALRRDLALPTGFKDSLLLSSGLGQSAASPLPLAIEVPWGDPWQIVDQIGFAYQAFAQAKKHSRAKSGLGLPRKIHGPRDDGPMQTRGGRFLQDPQNWKPPEWLESAKGDRRTSKKDVRHASPIHIHVARERGKYLIRVLAFPAAYLPDLDTSRAFLQEFLDFFAADLKRRAALPPTTATPPPRQANRSTSHGATTSHVPRPPAPRPAPPAGPTLPRNGERVEAELLHEKTKKGGWRGKHLASGISGPIQNTAMVPGEKQPGEKVTLVVAFANPREIAFRWPT